MTKNTDLDFNFDDEMSIRKQLNAAYDTRAQLAPMLSSASRKEYDIKLAPAFAFVAMLCYRSMQRDMPALRRCHFRVYAAAKVNEVHFVALSELDSQIASCKIATITVLSNEVLVRNECRFSKVDVNSNIDVVLDGFLDVIESAMLACVTTDKQKAAVSLLNDFRVYQHMTIEGRARRAEKKSAKKNKNSASLTNTEK